MTRIFNAIGDFLGAGSRPWWTASGTVCAQMNTFWASGDGVGHMGIYVHNTANTNAFTLVKHTDNNLYVGWTTGGVDARIVASDAGVFTAFTPLNSYIVDWNDTSDLQHFYINETLIGSSVLAFTVPGGNADESMLGAAVSGLTPWAGAIAEVGRWNRVLTSSERRILQLTRTPLSIPQGLVAYVPLIGRNSPEIELIAGQNLTVNGSPPDARHPRVFYPASPFVSSLTAAVISGPTIEPPLLSSAFQIFSPTVSVAGATLTPPLLSNAFQLFAPSVTLTGEQTLDAPLIDSSFQVFAPSVDVSESTIQEDSRELEPHNLRVRITNFVAGDDLRISRLYTGLTGGITISKAYLTIKRLAVDISDADALLQKQITASMTLDGKIVDAVTTGGSIEMFFDLSNDETRLIHPLIPYQYDVKVITVGNAIYTCEKGVIVMQQGVTEATS